MKFYVCYEQMGYAVTPFNYDNEMRGFLKKYKEYQECGTITGCISYCTELGIQMVRILILRKLVSCTDIVFCYGKHHLSPNKDANIDPWPDGFCDFTLNVLQELLDLQKENWKNELLPPSPPTEK